MNTPKKWTVMLTTQDLCKILHKDRKYVQWLRDYGLIPKRQIGRQFLITEAELNEFIEMTKNARLTNRADIITFSVQHKLKNAATNRKEAPHSSVIN